MQHLCALTGMFWFDSGGFVVGCRISIRRPWAKGRAGWRRDSPEQSSRGGAAPELAKSAAPGLGSACGLAVGGVRGVRSPPGGLFGFEETQSCASVGGGGSTGCGRR